MNSLTLQTKLLFAGAIFLVLLLFLSLFFLFQPTPEPEEENPVTPTPIAYTRDQSGNFRYTPLQKTEVGKTTQQDLEKSDNVVSKSTEGNATVYQVKSASPQKTDEIITENGVVVSERIDTFNKKAGKPPKLSIYQGEFGQPELILEGVSPLGLHIDAYIYASRGFTLFVNHSTKTVYQIHRYLPISLEEYRQKYAEYIAPAPPYPREFIGE